MKLPLLCAGLLAGGLIPGLLPASLKSQNSTCHQQLSASTADSAARQLVAAQNGLGLNLLQALSRAEPGQNIFLSPFSLSTALLMLADGAAGPARAAVLRTLGVQSLAPAALDTAVARQRREFTAPDEQGTMLLSANSLWADAHFPLAANFTSRLRTHYRAQAATLDFAAPTAAGTINRWMAEHTAGRITDVVQAPLLPPLLLANATYFKGRWQSEFRKSATKKGTFRQPGGQAQRGPLMQQRSTSFGYLRGQGWQAVRLPYDGASRRLSMQLFVPDATAGLAAFLPELTATNWAAWQAAFRQEHPYTEVNLTLPRFRTEWRHDLLDQLQAAGMAAALAPGADFTPMGFRPGAGPVIGGIRHQTYLAVDEQGTEAAAVTVTAMTGYGRPSTRPRHVTVRVDHPFFCAIVDDVSGAILFGGVICQPFPNTRP